uniref:DDE Tnp4 domain-containing protein n=2 Tax=Cyprinus carpio TaxID=7962 RepID=A0A8C1KK70_CYPCA
MPVPQESDWRAIAEGFSSKWAFPHCLGAIDGKHITIKAPADSGSLYYNYKGQFSIVLLAVVDANYLFRVVDIGAFGKSSDGGTLSASALGRALRDGTLNLPDDEPLPNGEHLGKVPFVFVGDEAFPLRKHLLRPYSGRAIPADQRIFNFRLSQVNFSIVCSCVCTLRLHVDLQHVLNAHIKFLIECKLSFGYIDAKCILPCLFIVKKNPCVYSRCVTHDGYYQLCPTTKTSRTSPLQCELLVSRGRRERAG